MSVNGYLSDRSLPEVFQLLQDGKKTGLLSIQGLASSARTTQYYFLWLHRGRIVALTHRLNSRGLAALISNRGYLSTTMTERLIRRCPPDEPLGRFLRSQGVLTTKQLQILFVNQVIRRMSDVLRVADGYFLFDPEAPIPKVEMTGLSVVATEAVLPGLRLLEDWEVFKDKLPHPQSALVSLVRGRPHIRINQVEWSVWRLIDEKTAIHQIADYLNLPILEVQQIAFRLIFVGLVQAVPQRLDEPVQQLPESLFSTETSEAEVLSPSFFRNLIGFLRQAPK
ncbi:MAG: DUF4388 domain-containing protein [Leptolyngbyaceae cyanobacterium]